MNSNQGGPNTGGGSYDNSPKNSTSYMPHDWIIEVFQKQQEKIKDLERMMDEAGKKHEALSKEQEILKKEFQASTEELKTDKHSLIAILGMFVAIFTFVSVEIQILKSVTDVLRIAGLSLIMISSLILFVMGLFLIAEKWMSKSSKFNLPSGYYIFVIIILAVGLILAGWGDYKNPAAVKNNSDFIALKEKAENNELIIENLTKKLDHLEAKQKESNVSKAAQDNVAAPPGIRYPSSKKGGDDDNSEQIYTTFPP